jgi:hypothetical protein
MPNNLGKIPGVFVYAERSPVRGIGISDIGDIADVQNSIYNELSEIEQQIRISGHPTLVKTIDTEASAGAGAIINVPNELDPGLGPRLLQPSGQSIDMILNSIETKVKMIDRMAHLGSVRAVEQRQGSGIRLQSEMLQLDSRLSEKAKHLQLAEEQIWRLFARWQNINWDGEVKYPNVFNIRDRNYEMDILKKAADAKPEDPRVKQLIDQKLVEVIETDEDKVAEFQQQQPLQTQLTHSPITNVNDMLAHLQEMIQQGYTTEQIKQLHPELEQLFGQEQDGDTQGQTINT